MKQNLTQVRTEGTAAAPEEQPIAVWEEWAKVRSELLRANVLLEFTILEMNAGLDCDSSVAVIEKVEGFALLVNDSKAGMLRAIASMELKLRGHPPVAN